MLDSCEQKRRSVLPAELFDRVNKSDEARRRRQVWSRSSSLGVGAAFGSMVWVPDVNSLKAPSKGPRVSPCPREACPCRRRWKEAGPGLKLAERVSE